MSTSTFTHPPHYSKPEATAYSTRADPTPSTEASTSGSLSLHAVNPHDKPTFNNELSHSEPILYLPPLLSSLPAGSEVTPSKDLLFSDTRLPSIDPVSLSLHKALHKFTPLTSEYASTPYAEAFNWKALQLPIEEEREWYCVVFRSLRKAGSNGDPLYEADKKAHEEAVTNGGLILYWYGTPHPVTGLNMASCIWQSRAHAMAANSRPDHIRAMRLAAASYEKYDLERWVLKKVAGEAQLQLEPYTGGEVGW